MLYNAFALLLALAAAFGYLNHRFLRLPATIGMMVLSLLLSLLLGFEHGGSGAR